jgi:hypothetical protein
MAASAISLRVSPPTGTLVRGYLVWVPGASHHSADVFYGMMAALSDEGYDSVCAHLRAPARGLPSARATG